MKGRPSWAPCLAAGLVLAGFWACREPAPTADLSDFPTTTELVPRLRSADVLTETGRIDLGDPDGRDFLVRGWSQDVFTAPDPAGDGEINLVWGEGEASEIDFTVLEPRDLRMEARCLPFSWEGAPEQTVAFELNGDEIGALALQPGLAEYSLTVPAASLRRGTNRLRMVYGYARAPRSVDPEKKDPRRLAVAWSSLTFRPGVSLADRVPRLAVEAAADLELPYGGEVSFFLSLPGESCLEISGITSYGDRGRLAARARFDLPAALPERSWRIEAPQSGTAALCFGNHGPATVGLTLAAEAGPPSVAEGGLRLGRPRIRSKPGLPPRAPEATPEETAARGPERRADAGDRDRPNVLLYLVDTLRADRLGIYGYPRPVSPHIDALADEALVFDRTWAQSSWTRCSVASILTGLLPTTHRTLTREDSLDPAATTLAEVLAAAGYDTAAFVANPHISKKFGFDQGFALFRRLGHPPPEPIYARSDELTGRVSRWLDRSGDRPFFLYVHTMDPHAPYAPPAVTAGQLAAEVRQPELDADGQRALGQYVQLHQGSFGANPDLWKLGSVPWIHLLDLGIVVATPSILGDLGSLYDAEIAFNDRSFGALLDVLRRRGRYDPTLVIFVSDHGEEFQDHGRLTHGKTLYREQLSVPLLIKLPGARPGDGRRRTSLAQHIDLLPTVLDLVGLDPPEEVQGTSLLAGIDLPGHGGTDGRPEHRTERAYAHLDFGGWRSASVEEGRFKLICTLAPSTCELYDREADPAETHDLAAERPVLVGYLRGLMRTYQDPESSFAAPAATIDPQLEQELRALGYN